MDNVEKWNKLNNQFQTVSLALETLYKRADERYQENGGHHVPSLEETVNMHALEKIREDIRSDMQKIEDKLVNERMASLKESYGLTSE